jgi:hypothetical protein
MIKVILVVVIVVAFLLIFGTTLGGILGILDLSVLTTFTTTIGTLYQVFATQFDLLLVSFPYTLTMIVVLMLLGIIGLVVSTFEKK